MDGALDGIELRGCQDTSRLEFDFSEFDLLPNSRDRRRIEFEPWMDDALRRYWMTKRQDAVAKKLGVSKNTCRRRYRELTGV